MNERRDTHDRPSPLDALTREQARSSAPSGDVLGEILVAEQVAELLSMRLSTVEDYARRGVLPSIKLGRHRRYVRSDVVAAIERLR